MASWKENNEDLVRSILTTTSSPREPKLSHTANHQQLLSLRKDDRETNFLPILHCLSFFLFFSLFISPILLFSLFWTFMLPALPFTIFTTLSSVGHGWINVDKGISRSFITSQRWVFQKMVWTVKYFCGGGSRGEGLRRATAPPPPPPPPSPPPTPNPLHISLLYRNCRTNTPTRLWVLNNGSSPKNVV